MINDGNAKLLAPCSLETLRNEQSDEILLNKVTMGQVEIRHHAIGVFSVKRFLRVLKVFVNIVIVQSIVIMVNDPGSGSHSLMTQNHTQKYLNLS